MTPFPAELEALMPPPFDLLYEFSSPFGGVVRRTSSNQYNGSAPKKSVPVFTADQVRQAMLDATERAAKKVEEVGPKEGSMALVTAGFAAAIRGGGQG